MCDEYLNIENNYYKDLYEYKKIGLQHFAGQENYIICRMKVIAPKHFSYWCDSLLK